MPQPQQVTKTVIDGPTCIPPQILLCQSEPPGQAGPGYIFCLCETVQIPTPPVKTCTMTIQWVKDDPRTVWLNKYEDGCDQAGLEIAIASALARLLSGAMY